MDFVNKKFKYKVLLIYDQKFKCVCRFCYDYNSCKYQLTYITPSMYTRNNMGQKYEGNCGLWVLNEIIKKTYPENLKKIVGAVWELPAK